MVPATSRQMIKVLAFAALLLVSAAAPQDPKTTQSSAPQDPKTTQSSAPTSTKRTTVSDSTQSTLPPIAIIKYENQVNLNMHPGSYKWAYEAGNGIKAQEEGVLKNSGENEFLSAKGSFSYINPDGEEIQLEYTADDNGFIAMGKHLPTPPPVPPEILAALEKNAADEAMGIFDDGTYKSDNSGMYKKDDSGKYTHDSSGRYNAKKHEGTKQSRSPNSQDSNKVQTDPVKTTTSQKPTTIRTTSTTTTKEPSTTTASNPASKETDKATDKPEPTEPTKESEEPSKITKRTTRNSQETRFATESNNCYIVVNDETYLKTTVDCVEYAMTSLALQPGPPYLIDSSGSFGQRIQRYDSLDYSYSYSTEEDPTTYYYK